MKSLYEIQKNVRSVFVEHFGRTPLAKRQKDIMRKALEVNRFTDVKNLKEELGQLLCSVLAGIDECEWLAEELVKETLELIKSRADQYKSLSRKLKVALLGGAFDPITNGHIQLAQFVLNASKEFDEVWITPCAHHVYNKEMEDAKHRLRMCELAIKVDRRIKIFDYEIVNDFSGETYHMVKRLLEEPISRTTSFSLIIGQDNANDFNKWINHEELERMARFVIVPRRGIEVNPSVDWYLKPPHIYLKPDDEVMKISSSEVRKFLKADELSCDEFLLNEALDQEVFQYIEKNKLYGR